MIAWLRRMFARRIPDPELEAHRALRAETAAAVTATALRARVVAGKVVRESRDDGLRDGFKRAGQRLAHHG